MKQHAFSLAILFFIIIHFSSCNNEDNPIGSVYSPVTVSSLSGKINLYEGANIIRAIIYTTSKAAIIGYDTIGADTILNLPLSEPSDEMLISVRELPDISGDGLNVSDSFARCSNFLAVTASGSSVSGRLRRTNDLPFVTQDSIGLCDVYYLYADRPVYLSGTVQKRIGHYFDYEFDLEMVKGWNVVSFEIRALSPGYIKYFIRAGEPSGSQWIFSIY